MALILEAHSAAEGLHDLALTLGAPTSLKQIGMREEDVARAAEIASANPYWNPRPIEKEAVRALLEDAFYGRRPGTAGIETTRTRRIS